MPTPSRNFFAFFGLDQKLTVDPDRCSAAFMSSAGSGTPDRFSRKPASEQAQSLEATAILNDGYRTLKDPVKHAEYVLTEEGFPIGEQRSKDVPAELLEEVFDLNMALEELKQGDESARPQLASAKENFLNMQGAIDRQLMSLFARYDASEEHSETARQALNEIRGVLNRRGYIENLLRDVDRAMPPSWPPSPCVIERTSR